MKASHEAYLKEEFSKIGFDYFAMKPDAREIAGNKKVLTHQIRFLNPSRQKDLLLFSFVISEGRQQELPRIDAMLATLTRYTPKGPNKYEKLMEDFYFAGKGAFPTKLEIYRKAADIINSLKIEKTIDRVIEHQQFHLNNRDSISMKKAH